MSNSIKSLATLLAFSLAAAPPSAHARPSPVDPRIRTYFIAADEVAWDYVPGGRDEIAGTALRRYRVLRARPSRGR